MSNCVEHEGCGLEPCQFSGTLRCGGCDLPGECPSDACQDANYGGWRSVSQIPDDEELS